MKILVISNNYPSNRFPNTGVFVYNLIQEFVKLGNEVVVIAPQGIKGLFRNGKSQEISYGWEGAEVYRPVFLSTSSKKILGYNTYSIGEFLQVYAVRRTIEMNHLNFDVVYAHFVSNAIIAARATSIYNRPVFAAIGESNIDDRRQLYNGNYFGRWLQKISGFISVSNKLKDKLEGFGVPNGKIQVLPNAVNLKSFYPRDKAKMREKFDLPMNKFLIIFVGRFIEHKGPLRVLEATKNMSNVGLIFIGDGDQVLESPQIVYKGKLPSSMVPELLSAADLFVLPTLKEGSCNSIVEAMACGLPIVSSDIPEVREQCDRSFSILVDPLNVTKIKDAIELMMKDAAKIKKMGLASLEASKNYDITNRAGKILDYLNSFKNSKF